MREDLCIVVSESQVSHSFFLIFHKKNTKPEVGCSGKSQQHRLLPPSFPPTSSLSTPYSFTSIFHPSRYSLITFFSSFINQVSVFLLFSELNLPSPRPISMPIPPSSTQNPHISTFMVERDHLKTTIPTPKNSIHGIAPQFAVKPNVLVSLFTR
ncbi:hypothetical protein ACN38_g6567 [Penicillium nordicum]|uniref:Uncharacterized protein n=1 Tax=Penicillium nordicum TaxID=229535 RepID=A0A0M9WF74_9EURO|nr:hypothetical protein ACN38_g6567 [Penicillium nordicum]